MLGGEDIETTTTITPCPNLYTAPNWYQSHIIAAAGDVFNEGAARDVIAGGGLIAYGARNMVQLLSSTSLAPIRTLTGHPKRVTAVLFVGVTKATVGGVSPRGESLLVASGCDGGNVMLWNVHSGECVDTLVPGGAGITALASTRNALVSGDDKGYLCMWGEVGKSGVVRYQPVAEKIITTSFSHHDITPYLAVGYRMGTINIMMLSGGKLSFLHSLKGHDSDIFRVHWPSSPPPYTSLPTTSHHHDILASVSRDKSVKLWDGATAKLLRTLPLPPRTKNRETTLSKEQPWLVA